MLQITTNAWGDWSASYVSSTGSISFKVGDTSNAVVLKNYTASTFNVNGSCYEVSDNKFVRR